MKRRILSLGALAALAIAFTQAILPADADPAPADRIFRTPNVVSFLGPKGITVEGDQVWVVDSDHHQVTRFHKDDPTDDMRIGSSGPNGSSDPGQFILPSDIAHDASGNVYVVEPHNNRVQKFDFYGDLLASWGGEGSLPGEFSQPQGIGVDQFTGTVYVADTGNDRVQAFDGDGNPIASWPSYHPADVAAGPDGRVYVVEFGAPYIHVFDAAGTPLAEWGNSGGGDGEFYAPVSIAVDPLNGEVFVADYDRRLVQRFDADGVFISSFGDYPLLQSPIAVAVDESHEVYVTDQYAYGIKRFDADGALIESYGSYGSGPGQFSGPFGAAFDQFGNIYVTDSGNNRVQRFSPNGEFVTEFATGGLVDYPFGIAIQSDGDIYVADSSNGRIQVFDASGAWRETFGSQGNGPGEFLYPRGLAFDSAGNLFVIDYGNFRVQKFDVFGNYVTSWGTQGTGDGQFSQIWSVAVDAAGDVYVADTSTRKVQKFTNDGDFVTSWMLPGQFSTPFAVGVSPAQRVFVADTHNSTVHEFDTDGNFIAEWGVFGGEAGAFGGPSAFAFESDRMLVTEGGNQRFQVFSMDPPPSPDEPTVSLSASNSTLPCGGSTLITATVLDEDGLPVPDGSQVNFSVFPGIASPSFGTTTGGAFTTVYEAPAHPAMAYVSAGYGSVFDALYIHVDCIASSPTWLNYNARTAFGSDGNPIMVSEGTYGGLVVIDCNDPVCAGDDETVTRLPYLAAASDIVTDSSGNPVIAYFDTDSHSLVVLSCNDPACAGQDDQLRFLDNSVSYYRTELELDAFGNPVISVGWEHGPDNGLRVFHCADPLCTTSSFTEPDPGAGSVQINSLLLDAGNPVIVYQESNNYGLRILRCNDPDCAGGNDYSAALPIDGMPASVGLALEGGNPVIGYMDYVDVRPELLRCDDPVCDGVGDVLTTVVGGSVANSLAMALDASGTPVFAMEDPYAPAGTLKVLYCGSPACDVPGTITTEPTTYGAGTVSVSGIFLDGSDVVVPYVAYTDDEGYIANVFVCTDCATGAIGGDTDGDGEPDATDPDDDNDAVADEIDPSPGVPGNVFSDGTTAGTYTIVGTVELSITDATPGGGLVEVSGGGPGNMVIVQLDGKATSFAMTSGSMIITDPPKTSTVHVISGGPVIAEVPFGSTTLTVVIENGETASVVEDQDDLGQVLGVEIVAIEGTITVEGKSIPEGGSVGIDVPVGCPNTTFDNVIFGTTGNDTLNGTLKNDLIIGLEGDDKIDGKAGNDCLIGGRGKDKIDGGLGNDSLSGDEGDDTLDGGVGDDTLDGGSANNKLDGGVGNDVLIAGDGNDTMDGGVGDDVLTAGNGANKLSGGAGDDTLTAGDGDDTLDGGVGEDRITGGGGIDRIEGGAGNDLIDAGEGNDIVSGGVGEDLIYGVGGNDTITAGAGEDEVHGGTGNDRIEGDAGADRLYGDEDADTIYGGAGNDTLIGGTEVDSATGASGQDACEAETEATCESNP